MREEATGIFHDFIEALAEEAQGYDSSVVFEYVYEGELGEESGGETVRKRDLWWGKIENLGRAGISVLSKINSLFQKIASIFLFDCSNRVTNLCKSSLKSISDNRISLSKGLAARLGADAEWKSS